MNNLKRLVAYCEHQGIKNKVYVELLEDIEKAPQLMYFQGSDYHNADVLASWGFLQRVIKPVFSKDGNYVGTNVSFFSVFCNLKHVSESDQPF